MQLEVALLNDLFEADCYKTLISLIVCIKLNDDEPAHEIMVLIANANSKGSNEPMQMHKFTRAISFHMYDI